MSCADKPCNYCGRFCDVFEEDSFHSSFCCNQFCHACVVCRQVVGDYLAKNKYCCKGRKCARRPVGGKLCASEDWYLDKVRSIVLKALSASDRIYEAQAQIAIHDSFIEEVNKSRENLLNQKRENESYLKNIQKSLNRMTTALEKFADANYKNNNEDPRFRNYFYDLELKWKKTNLAEVVESPMLLISNAYQTVEGKDTEDFLKKFVHLFCKKEVAAYPVLQKEVGPSSPAQVRVEDIACKGMSEPWLNFKERPRYDLLALKSDRLTEKNILSLWMLKSFWKPNISDDYEKFGQSILKDLNENSSTPLDIFGNFKKVFSENRLFYNLRRLGVVYNEEVLKNINGHLCKKYFTDRASLLKEIHICIPKSLKVKEQGGLPLALMKILKLHLHFPLLGDVDVNFVRASVEKVLHDGKDLEKFEVIGLHFPLSTLTELGAVKLLHVAEVLPRIEVFSIESRRIYEGSENRIRRNCDSKNINYVTNVIDYIKRTISFC